MTKAVHFRGKFDEIFTFQKCDSVLRRLIYLAAMCVKSVVRDYHARNSSVILALIGEDNLRKTHAEKYAHE